MAKKGFGQERENKTLCSEKSLTISKQECAQWEGRAVRWKERAAQLEKENQTLKEKLGTNSRNSFKPSSQDPFRRSLDLQVENQGASLAILAT